MESPAEPVNWQGGTIGTQDVAGGLADRGIGFQAAGFAVTWFASTTILKLFAGSDFWLYQWFEKATVDTYWAAVLPLAFLFDWVRKMFERGKAIREAKMAEILEKMRQQLRVQMREEVREQVQEEVREQVQEEVRERVQQGVRAEIDRIRKALLESPSVTLPTEVANVIFGDVDKNVS